MYKYFLSRRYLLARPTNWIGIIGITVGVGAMVMILSIMTGFLGETRRMVRGSLSDILITPTVRGGAPLPDPQAIVDLVRKQPGVKATSVELSWFGMLALEGADLDVSRQNLANADSTNGVRLIGIDVADQLAATDLGEALRREPFTIKVRDEEIPLGCPVLDPERPFAAPPGHPRPGQRELARVLVGEQLARNWHLERGSVVRVFTVAPNSRTDKVIMNNRDYVVAGTFRSRDNELDGGTLYFERDELESLLGDQLSFTQVLVRLEDYERDGRALREELEALLIQRGVLQPSGRRQVNTWENYKQTLLAAIENERVLMAIMLSLVLLVAGFTIFAILSMMVVEKRRDIGILSALGATPAGIHGLFTLIAFWDALLGCALGAWAGVSLAHNIDGIEQWLSKQLEVQIFNRDAYLFDYIPAIVDPWAVAAIVAFAFSCTLAFAFIPAWRAGRMHPLDALRHE